ncbi:MAG TPA: S-methyl-5'-thioadenosine phosphorylase [Bauldia sp.]|nr:S-methyl-5'-thioadenosine phosphorylase [Bauldia sp.]
MTQALLGIIGGSGVYALPGVEDLQEKRVASPWGEPSDAIRTGRIGETRVAFLPRHGRGHRYAPGDINYRANIDALKRIGVTDLVSVSAVGSLREDLPPGTFVLVDQYVDRTVERPRSFFGKGLVAHVSMARPVSPRLADRIAAAGHAEGIACRRGGTLVVIEGPQFSSEAESRLYRDWGADLVGMTAMPEAKLAREAEIAYATLAMVTDYDSWHPGHDAVDVAAVVRVLEDNRGRVQRLLVRLARDFPADHEPCPYADRALDGAVMTAPDARDPALLAKLDAVAGRILRTPEMK